MRRASSSRGFAVAVVMTITVIGVLSLPLPHVATNSQSIAPQCVQKYTGGLPQFGQSSVGASPGELVLLLPPNSVSALCVEYVGNPSTQYSGNEILQPAIGVEECSSTVNETSCHLVPSADIWVTASPTNITLGARTNTTVVYSINTTGIYRSLYFLVIPYNCPSVPIAVGYGPSQLNSTDFPSMGPVPCPIPAVQASITASSNLNYTYLGY